QPQRPSTAGPCRTVPPHRRFVHSENRKHPRTGPLRWTRRMQPEDSASWWGHLREIAAQTCSLVAPRQCPCGEEGTLLCARCIALLEAEPQRVEQCCDALQELSAARVRDGRVGAQLLPAGVDHTPLLPVLALGEYEGDLQRLILAWKKGGMLHLAARLAPALLPAVHRLTAPTGAATVHLVPVPSQRSARLRRGEDHTAELVRAMQRCGAGHAL